MKALNVAARWLTHALPKHPSERLVVLLTALAIGMLCFAVFVMPPLYSVFCDITGINGKTAITPETLESINGKRARSAPSERTVTLQLVTSHNNAMPWLFEPDRSSIQVQLGQEYRVNFIAKNTTQKTMTAQAIPSISPSVAANHLTKIECFCFEQQTLQPGESTKLPMFFTMDSDLPDSVKKLTLAYTLFDISDFETADH